MYRTGKTAGIGVSDAMIGRVVDALGAPIDDAGDIRADEYRMIESRRPRHHRPPAGQHPHADRYSVHRFHVSHRTRSA